MISLGTCGVPIAKNTDHGIDSKLTEIEGKKEFA